MFQFPRWNKTLGHNGNGCKRTKCTWWFASWWFLRLLCLSCRKGSRQIHVDVSGQITKSFLNLNFARIFGGIPLTCHHQVKVTNQPAVYWIAVICPNLSTWVDPALAALKTATFPLETNKPRNHPNVDMLQLQHSETEQSSRQIPTDPWNRSQVPRITNLKRCPLTINRLLINIYLYYHIAHHIHSLSLNMVPLI